MGRSKKSSGDNLNRKRRGAPLGNKNAVGNRGGGAPLGNKNAVGNCGGGAPVGNQNAYKHGGYRHYRIYRILQQQIKLLH